MNNFKKQLFFILFTLSASLLAFSGVSAQTWKLAATAASNGNPCVTPNYSNPSAASLMVAGDQGQCSCPQGYTYGTAVDANCTMDGFVAGCWNPNNGTCNACGSGGTIPLAGTSCFNNGQANSGGNGAGNPPMGVTCVSTGGAYSTQCISSGTNSGGYSTN